MIDIDHFKIVNDKFGHIFGDKVLLLLAQTMVANLRSDDVELTPLLQMENPEGGMTPNLTEAAEKLGIT